MDALGHTTRTALSSSHASAGGRIRQENESRILQAAERIFARAGFAGATMAGIAALAGVPKSNLHYYFRTKQALYRAVLAHTLELWLSETDIIDAGQPPQAALEHYIRAKMRLSESHPDASRVFANELLHGAPEIGDILRGALRSLVLRKATVIRAWIDSGQMAEVDPSHLFFTIWACTQTYADFESQVCAVLGVSRLDRRDYEQATEHLVALLLRGCGLAGCAPDRGAVAARDGGGDRESRAGLGARSEAHTVSTNYNTTAAENGAATVDRTL